MQAVSASVTKVLLVLALISVSPLVRADDPKFPASCQSECVTAFGEELGKTKDGIVAFSNCKPSCVFESPMTVDGTYTGIRWQCVEYARRWLLKHVGAVFASVDYAFEIWSKIEFLEKPGTKEKLALQNFPNGSGSAPRAGDLLIYAKEHEDTGHVAVVTAVDSAKKVLKVAEQNFKNEKWKNDHARAVPFVANKGKYWVLDTYILGWKRVSP